MHEFCVDGTKVTFEKTTTNVDALEQVIHPLAVVRVNLTRNGEAVMNEVEYQLDAPNEPHLPFDHRQLILDMCIRKMVKKEEATVKFDGEVYTVHVIEVVNCLPLWEVDTDTRLDQAEQLRQIGNDYFKEKKDDCAMHAYKRALFWASIVDQAESKAVRQRMRAQIISNISAVHAAAKDNKKTIFTAGEALDIGEQIGGALKNKNNVLLRRAWSLAQLNEFGPAQMDLDLIEDPTEPQLKRMRQISSRIRQVTKQTDQKMSKGLSKMFG